MHNALFLNPIHHVGDPVTLTPDEFESVVDDIHQVLIDPNLTHATISIVGHYANGDVLFETDKIETGTNGERMLTGQGTVIPMGDKGLELYNDHSESILIDILYSNEHDEPGCEVCVTLPNKTCLDFTKGD